MHCSWWCPSRNTSSQSRAPCNTALEHQRPHCHVSSTSIATDRREVSPSSATPYPYHGLVRAMDCGNTLAMAHISSLLVSTCLLTSPFKASSRFCAGTTSRSFTSSSHSLQSLLLPLCWLPRSLPWQALSLLARLVTCYKMTTSLVRSLANSRFLR